MTPLERQLKQLAQLKKKKQHVMTDILRSRIQTLQKKMSSTPEPAKTTTIQQDIVYLEKQIKQHREKTQRLAKQVQLEQIQIHYDQLRRLQNILKKIENLVMKYKRQGSLTQDERQELRHLRRWIEKQEKIISNTDDQLSYTKKGLIGNFRTKILPVKFSYNYYQFLMKKMIHAETPIGVIRGFHTSSDHGFAFEAMWALLISLGFCQQFNRADYDFYDAELKEPTDSTPTYFITKIITNSDFMQFLKQTPIKGVNGKSDITLRRKHDGRWIFISCKYYVREHGDYDIQAIYDAIEETNKKYSNLIGNNYDIYIFANNREEAATVIQNSALPDKVKNKNKTNGVYNILGMEELNTCFKEFKSIIKNMSIGDFEKQFIKHYSELPTLKLRLDQMPIVNKTMDLLLENMEQQKCQGDQNLKMYWKTIPQFGKTYCIGSLLLEYSSFHMLLTKQVYFNTVVIVDRVELMKKYTREVLGGHTQFVDDFYVMEIRKEDHQNQTSINRYLRTNTKQKIRNKLNKSVNQNNIVVVLKRDLDLVNDLQNIRWIVFDQYDEQSEDQFQTFTHSPDKIGLFMTSSRSVNLHENSCSYLLEWKLEDSKSMEQISKQLKQNSDQSVLSLKSTKSFLQKHQESFGRTARVPLTTATPQDFDRCLRNSLDLYIISKFFQPERYNFNHLFKIQTSSERQQQKQTNKILFKERDEVEDLLKKIKEILVMISNKKGGERLVATTQLWFLPFTNNFKISENLRTMMENDEYFGQYEIVINKEPENTNNPNRHPPPLVKQERKLGQLVSHYQTRTISQRKKGLIFLLDPKVDMKGVSLPNVDIVFSLNDETNLDLSYLMFSKCITPKQGKDHVYFVDFRSYRIFNLLKKEFGNIQTIRAKKLFHLLDMDEPQLNSSQVLNTLILMESEQLRKKDDETTIPSQNIRKQQTKLASSDPKTTQDWRSKAPSSLGKNQLRQMAKHHDIRQEQYLHLNKSNLYNLLRSKNIITPRPYTKSSK